MRWPSGECASLVTDFYPWNTQYEEKRTDCCLLVLTRALAQTPVHTLHTLIKKRSSFTFQVHTPICLEGNAPNDRIVIWANYLIFRIVIEQISLFQQLLKFLNECGLVTSSSQKICVYLNNCKCVAVYVHNSLPYTHPLLTTTANPSHMLTQGQLPRPRLGCVLHFNFWAVPTEASGTTSVTLRQKPSSVHFLHPAD